MGVVSVAEAWPGAGRPFTVQELARMPDDGHRYELLDGSLVVSPRPGMLHQAVAGELFFVLRLACVPGLRVVPEPAVQLSADTEFVPDLAVVAEEEIAGTKCLRPPLLVVEVRSPSTALIDLNRKKDAYERFGVPSYWIMVPDQAAPELIAFELRDGRYRQAAIAADDEVMRVTRPFAVEITPRDLLVAKRARPGS
jgi:Uma2 family endonuclease